MDPFVYAIIGLFVTFMVVLGFYSTRDMLDSAKTKRQGRSAAQRSTD